MRIKNSFISSKVAKHFSDVCGKINSRMLLSVVPFVIGLSVMYTNNVFADSQNSSSDVATENEERKNVFPIYGSNVSVELNAALEFEFGSRKQNKLEENEKNISAKKSGFAFNNSAAFSAKLYNLYNDVKYGGRIVLVPTSKRSGGTIYSGSHIFVESDYGKVELGAPKDPAATMFVDGYDISTAAGSHWSRYVNFDSAIFKHNNLETSFAGAADFVVDDKLSTDLSERKYSSEPSRRVVYYSPKIDVSDSTNLSVGVAFTPDSSNTGGGSLSQSSGKREITEKNADGVELTKMKFDSSVKNIFSGGIRIEHNLSDGVDLKLGLTGEYGQSAGGLTITSNLNDENNKQENKYKLSNMRTYNIGVVLTMGNFSYAGGYGSLRNSLTSPEYHKTGRKTVYYSGGIGYNQGPFSTSLVYFKSNQYKNEVTTLTLGADYQMAPGLLPFIGVTAFRLEGKPEYFPEREKAKTRGTTLLMGLKLKL